MQPEQENNTQGQQPQAPNPQAEAPVQPQASPDTSREDALKAKLSQISDQKPVETTPAPPTPAADTQAPAEPAPEPMPVITPDRPVREESPVSAAIAPTEIPKEFPTQGEPQRISAHRKTVGIFITILLLGLITVAGVFAAKLTTDPTLGTKTVLASATENFLNQDVFAYNATVSVDFDGQVDGDMISLNGNATYTGDTIIKKDSFQSKGIFLLGLSDDSLNLSLSHVNIDNDLYLSIDSFSFNITENSPEELAALAFFPLDQFVGKWIRIPSENISQSTGVLDEEYATQTEAANAYLENLKSISENENWQDILTNYVVNDEGLSSDSHQAYSMNLTWENLLETLQILDLNHLADEIETEDIQSALDFINNQVVYIDAGSETLSSITLTNQGYANDEYTMSVNTTIASIPETSFEAPAEFVELEVLFEEMFGFGDL
jgi:hypothetical protein